MIAIENARLFAEVEAKTRDLEESLAQQTATADVLKAISRSAFDLDSVLKTLVESARELCHASIAGINVLSGEFLRFRAQAGGNPEFEAFLRANPAPVASPTRANNTGRVLLTKAASYVADVANDPDYAFGDAPRLGGFRSLLGVPLLREGEVIGVFQIGAPEPGALSQRQIDLVSAFADQAVIAIENARLFEEVQARTRDLEESLAQQVATAEVLQVIASSPSKLDPVFDMIVRRAAVLCEAETSAVLLLRNNVIHMARQNISTLQESLANLHESLGKSAFPAPLNPGTAAGRAMLSRAVVHIPDIAADPDYTSRPIVLTGIRSLLSAPMLLNGEPIGAVNVSRMVVKPFSARQIELLETFAAQAVIAIQNVRLFDAVQAKTREVEESLAQQTATAEVLKVISRSAFDLQTVLDTLTSSAARLCEAEKACIFLRRGETYHWSSNYGFNQELVVYAEAHPFTAGGNGATSRVARDGVVVHLPDVLADPEYTASEYQRLGNYRTVLGAPLWREGEPIGVFIMTREAVRPFKPRQIELLQTFADQAVIAIENARLFEEVQAKTSDLEEALSHQVASTQVLQTIGTSMSDAQPVFERILDALTARIDQKMCNIFLTPGDGLLHLVAHRGALSKNLENVYPRPVEHTAVPIVLRSGRQTYFPDALNGPDVPESLRASAKVIGNYGDVLTPMIWQGRGVGMIAVVREPNKPFSERELNLLQTFADQAVIAIENSRLFGEVQARTRDLEESLAQQTATADVLKVISRSAFDLQAVFDALLTSAVDLVDGGGGAIALREGENLRFRARAYPSGGQPIDLVGRVIPIDRSSASGRAASSGRTEYIPDAASDPEFHTLASTAWGQSYLSVPLLRNGGIEGALTIISARRDAFSKRHIELIQTFADQAIIAIENTRLFDEVQTRTRELEQSLSDLRKAQDRLVQSEKLASLGQLTAGIAHEIKNPLNFVNNFASLSRELLEELRETLERLPEDARADADDLMGLIDSNLEKVASHGRRADSIVKNMLLHSREGSGERARVTVNAMVEEALNLGYHGARAEKPGFNVTLERDFDPRAGEADLYLQEITRVLLNLISNGFYAIAKRKLDEGPDYAPTLKVTTRDLGHSVEIRIRDNGTGIPDEVRAKMFNPFFTTKPAGEGTGLGLSLSHDIVVKQHGGTLDVETAPAKFTEFVITLPREGAGT